MEDKRITPMRAIRAKCLDCSCGSFYEVKQCPMTDCSLYPFRFGKNPNRAGIINNGSFKKKHDGLTDVFSANVSGV